MSHQASRWRLIPLFIIAGLLAPLATILPQEAAVAANSGWPVKISVKKHLSQLLTHPDGGITYASCGHGHYYEGQADFLSFDPNGGQVGSLSTTSNRIDSCQPNVVAGREGMLYNIEHMADGKVKQLGVYRHGRRQWAFNLRSECASAYADVEVRGLTAGPNGDLYVAVHTHDCDQLSLYGVTAAGKLKFVHRLGFSQAVSGSGEPSQVFASKDGPVVIQNPMASSGKATIRYFDFDGKEITSRRHSLALQPNERPFVWDVNFEGAIFVATVRGDSNRSQPCNDSAVTERIIRRDTAGKILIYNMAPHCMRAKQLRTTPGGGAVVAHEAEQFYAELETKPLFILTGDGKVKPQVVRSSFGDEAVHSVDDVQVGINGNALITYQTHQQSDDLDISELALLSPSGSVLARHNTAQYWDEDRPGRVYATRGTGPAMTNGAVYFVACQRRGLYDTCNDGEEELHWVPFLQASGEYPGALIAGVKAPPAVKEVRLGAIGDSFMANLGVDPQEPSEADPNCARSLKAYSRLLDEDPTINVTLKLFVACSGATSQEVINGKPGDKPEPSQLKGLTKDLDVVLVSAGGNDIGFDRYARSCVFNCDETSGAYKDSVRLLKDVPGSIATLIKEIRKRVRPDTRIIVVGYPDISPVNERDACWPLNEEEAKASHKLLTGLNSKLRAGVGSTGNRNDRFVDLQQVPAFTGHDFCSGDSYFIRPATDWLPHTLHPNEKGVKEGYVEVIKQHLR